MKPNHSGTGLRRKILCESLQRLRWRIFELISHMEPSCRGINMKRFLVCDFKLLFTRKSLWCDRCYAARTTKSAGPPRILRTATKEGRVVVTVAWDGKVSDDHYSLRLSVHFYYHFISSSLRLGLHFSMRTIPLASRTWLVSLQSVPPPTIFWRFTYIEMYPASLWHRQSRWYPQLWSNLFGKYTTGYCRAHVGHLRKLAVISWGTPVKVYPS